MAGTGIQSIPRRTHSGPCPLSFAQQRLWFLNQLAPDSPAYNQPKAIRLKGILHVPALKKSLDAIVDRHEALRTTVLPRDGNPVQVVADNSSVQLPTIDLSAVPADQQERELERVIAEITERPFDLSRDLMLRAALMRLLPAEHVLLLVTHHIASDGWSSGILFRELTTLYAAFSRNQTSPLADLPVQYADFALWQREWLQDEVLETQLSHWKKQLSGTPTLELPTDRPRRAVQTFRGARQSFLVPKTLSGEIRALSRRNRVTLFMTLVAAFQTLLSRYAGQEDIPIGVPIANRTRVEIEGLIGFFANTLVLRTDLSGNPTLQELLSRVREVALGAYANQDLPFERLVEEINPDRDLSRNPLFQVTFNLQNPTNQEIHLPGLTLSSLPAKNTGAKFDLSLSLLDKEQELAGTIEYNCDLFDAATIRRMSGHYQTVLRAIVADPDRRLSDLPILAESERHQLLVEWTETGSDYPAEVPIHELFEAQAARTPAAVAVEYEGRQLSYGELNARANQLARYLARHGVGPEVMVGLCVERSLEMVVGVLGILKAGGAYVPLDPDYPAARLAFMLEDTAAPVLLTQAGLRERLPAHAGRTVSLDAQWREIARESEENPKVKVGARNLAYVIYTSGSTGRPKGTCIEHRSVVRLVKATNYIELGPQEVILQFAPISFDASTFELWGSLLNGAKLVVCPAGLLSLQELGRVIQERGVSTLWLTAALFHQMVDEQIESLRGVRQILAGGETLSVSHVRRMLEVIGGGRLINGYGPTENTTFTCAHVMTAASRIEHTVPIGRPISNTRVYVLDSHMQPVPVGVYGELYIGGDGLAREYLHQPQLTAEKFVPDPFSGEPGARLYRSGDLVRFLADGNIEFLGRIDDQVKLRGYRIELGEIEATLVGHPAVRQAVAMVREDAPGDKRLVAYIVAQDPSADRVGELRALLRATLPEYMVPAAFVTLDQFPLTANGKVDRAALPAPERSGAETTYVAPRTPSEEALAEIFADVLGVKRVGIHDNFFELGGHSLLASQVVSRASDRFDLHIPLKAMFEEPTLAGFADCIAMLDRSRKAREESGDAEKVERFRI